MIPGGHRCDDRGAVRRPGDNLRDPLARARSTLIAIRDHADHGIRDDPG
jgi:hypothetical protein